MAGPTPQPAARHLTRRVDAREWPVAGRGGGELVLGCRALHARRPRPRAHAGEVGGGRPHLDLPQGSLLHLLRLHDELLDAARGEGVSDRGTVPRRGSAPSAAESFACIVKQASSAGSPRILLQELVGSPLRVALHGRHGQVQAPLHVQHALSSRLLCNFQRLLRVKGPEPARSAASVMVTHRDIPEPPTAPSEHATAQFSKSVKGSSRRPSARSRAPPKAGRAPEGPTVALLGHPGRSLRAREVRGSVLNDKGGWPTRASLCPRHSARPRRKRRTPVLQARPRPREPSGADGDAPSARLHRTTRICSFPPSAAPERGSRRSHSHPTSGKGPRDTRSDDLDAPRRVRFASADPIYRRAQVGNRGAWSTSAGIRAFAYRRGRLTSHGSHHAIRNIFAVTTGPKSRSPRSRARTAH